MTPTEEPIPFTDEHGQPCLRVPLINAPDTFAIVDRHHYATLQRIGLAERWLLNGNGSGKRYVRVAVPVEGRSTGTLLLVARLIVGAGPGTVVRYLDGDPLNLRFHNLLWRKGKSGREDAAVLSEAVRFIDRRNARPINPNHTTLETPHNATL